MIILSSVRSPTLAVRYKFFFHFISIFHGKCTRGHHTENGPLSLVRSLYTLFSCKAAILRIVQFPREALFKPASPPVVVQCQEIALALDPVGGNEMSLTFHNIM